MQLEPEDAESALETDLSNRMLAFGGRSLVSARAGESGRFELALRSDALLTQTDSEAVQGLAAAQGATSRVRVLLEGSGSLPVWGGTLRPTVEAGLRYDGGDAETGAGRRLGTCTRRRGDGSCSEIPGRVRLRATRTKGPGAVGAVRRRRNRTGRQPVAADGPEAHLREQHRGGAGDRSASNPPRADPTRRSTPRIDAMVGRPTPMMRQALPSAWRGSF